MLLSAVSVLVVAQSSSEIPDGLMNNPVLFLNLKPSEVRPLYFELHVICRADRPTSTAV